MDILPEHIAALRTFFWNAEELKLSARAKERIQWLLFSFAFLFATMGVTSGSVHAAESNSFRLYSDAPNYSTNGPSASNSFSINEDGATWATKPGLSTNFRVNPAPQEASPSVPSSTGEDDSTGGGDDGSVSGGRRPCPLPGGGYGPCPSEVITEEPEMMEQLPGQKQEQSIPVSPPIQQVPEHTATPEQWPDWISQPDAASAIQEFDAVSVHYEVLQVQPIDRRACPDDSFHSAAPETAVCGSTFNWLLLLLLFIALCACTASLSCSMYQRGNAWHIQSLHNKQYCKWIFFVLLCIASIATSTMFVEIVQAVTTGPQTHVYNGHLLDSSGNAVTTAHTIRLSYWKSADFVSSDLTAAGAINASASNYAGWYEEHTITPNSDGYFSVNLGETNTLPNFRTMSASTLASLFLQEEVKASGAPDTSYELLDHDATSDTIDRASVLSVPFAFNADLLDQRDIGTGSGSIPLLRSDGMLRLENSTASGAITLQFGATLMKELSYDRINERFNFNAPLSVQGGVTIGNVTVGSGTGAGTLRWTGINFEGFDGSAWNSLTGGGNTGGGSAIIQEGDTTVVQTGATLDFDASDFDITEAPADEANISLNTAGLRTRLDDTYVNQAGDTMTGDLAVQGNISGTTLNINSTITFNGVSYTWPSTGGVLNQFLTSNGDGTLSYKDINDITQITGSIASGDEVLIYDTSIGAHRRISRDSFLSGILGALTYQGTWNASTNLPSLSDGTGTKGYYYVVSTAGTQDLGSGNITFAVNDYAIHNGSAWEKLANVDTISSVFGRQGVVTAQPNDYSGAYITFDNASSGLSSTNVQSAIDEIDITLDEAQAANDVRYVNVSGDTMTGALNINQQIGTMSLSASGTIRTASGFVLNYKNAAQDAVLVFGNNIMPETIKFVQARHQFEFSDDVHVEGDLTASGTLVIEGAATFGSTITAGGVTYAFPGSDGGSSGAVLKTNSSGTLNWGLIGTGSLALRTRRIIVPLKDATVVGDGTDNEMNVFAATQTGSTSNIHHYFRAETGSGQLQDIDIRLKVQLPQDFVNFTDASDDLRFSYRTDSSSSSVNKVDILVEDDDGDSAFTASDGQNLVNVSWTDYTDEFDGGSFNPVAGEYIYITIKAYTAASAMAYAGEVVITYTGR